MSRSQEYFPDETTEAHPETICNLKKSNYILLVDRPCKISNLMKTKVGKHGCSKTNIEAIDIFNGFKHTYASKSNELVTVPKVKVEEYILVDIDEDDFLELVDINGNPFEDKFQLFGEEIDKLSDTFDDSLISKTTVMVSVLSAMGMHKVISFREK